MAHIVIWNLVNSKDAHLFAGILLTWPFFCFDIQWEVIFFWNYVPEETERTAGEEVWGEGNRDTFVSWKELARVTWIMVVNEYIILGCGYSHKFHPHTRLSPLEMQKWDIKTRCHASRICRSSESDIPFFSLNVLLCREIDNNMDI